MKTRPGSSVYNGGPGAATVWLHMGSFAPRHVQMADEGLQPAPPYHFVDNDNSLIEVADLVFIDAISTGYSRTMPATDVDAAGDTEEFDPSNTALRGAYMALFSDYVKSDLKWDTDLHYDTSGNVRPWTYDQNRYMDMTEPLRQTMAKNPFLKVFIAAGYYDMATSVPGSEINFWFWRRNRRRRTSTLNHLNPEPRTPNLVISLYS